MKIIPFSSSVGFCSKNNKNVEQPDVAHKEDNHLTTGGAKKILGNTLLLTAAGIFSYLTVDTIIMKKNIAKDMAPIVEAVSDECKENFGKILKHFNDWQKSDLIKAYKSGVSDAEDKSRLVVDSVMGVINKVKGKASLTQEELAQEPHLVFKSIVETFFGK